MASKTKLDMDHGFMKSIIRNQVDRDNYDKEVKDKQAEKITSGRKQKRETKTYQPPSKRKEAVVENTEKKDDSIVNLFEFQYEDEKKEIHKLIVRKGDDPHKLARKFGAERKLNSAMTQALEELLRSEIAKARNSPSVEIS